MKIILSQIKANNKKNKYIIFKICLNNKFKLIQFKKTFQIYKIYNKMNKFIKNKFNKNKKFKLIKFKLMKIMRKICKK